MHGAVFFPGGREGVFRPHHILVCRAVAFEHGAGAQAILVFGSVDVDRGSWHRLFLFNSKTKKDPAGHESHGRVLFFTAQG